MFSDLYIHVEIMKESYQMGISCLNLSISYLVQQKANKNRDLTQISDKRDMVTTRVNKLIQASDGSWYKDPEIKALQNQEDSLDLEIKSIETDLQYIEECIEAFEKQKDSNIKDEVPSLAS